MHTTTVNGIALSYEDRGAGLPVLLVHGFPLDHTMWSAQIDDLGRDHRLIAPDLRGFGRSDAGGSAPSLRQYADDLDELLTAAGVDEPCVLCGLSMGGYIALEFVRHYRPRLAALVLCDTRAEADSPETAAARRATAERVLREGLLGLADSMPPRLLSASAAERRPHLHESVRDTILRMHPQGVAAASLAMAGRADAQDLLPSIVMPTLVVVGADDALSPPAQMRELAERLPHGHFVEIPAAGHLSPLENPARFNAALREFLADLPRA